MCGECRLQTDHGAANRAAFQKPLYFFFENGYNKDSERQTLTGKPVFFFFR